MNKIPIDLEMTELVGDFENPLWKLKMMRYEERRWILKVTLKVILAPVTFVTFADIWVSYFNEVRAL